MCQSATYIRHCCNKENRKSLRFPVLFLHDLTKDYGNNGVNEGCDDCGTDDGCRIDTAVLLSVGNHADWNQLKGGNVND